ncbi:hypothetical protein [Escherichia albertii]|uniref:hypothetical protein n=1 Tax=Escherichia albertii TaxID=208962 RepID=UPI001FCEE165|nr:hypothetical protein [Escherichia albertii]MCZ8652360.1 hypothetical protein [Escherichia albertii]WDB36707.1 hypothetical protein PS032_15980 [Escherichia albertii]
MNKLAKRLQEWGLELHPEKTKIVYCKDSELQANHEIVQFDFLGICSEREEHVTTGGETSLRVSARWRVTVRRKA